LVGGPDRAIMTTSAEEATASDDHHPHHARTTMSTPGPARGGYAAWVQWIEAFRRGEDPSTDGLGAIGAGLGSYVEARLLDRLSAAFTERVRQWQKALGDAIVVRPPESPAAAAAMLRDALVRLDPLATLAASPLLPPSLGASMQAMLDQVRDGARAALDDVWRRRTEEGAGEVPA
jgi:hypothetical protein